MRRSSRPSRAPSFVPRALALACFCAGLPAAQAATYAVSTEAELQAAIAAVNVTPGANFIDLRANIDLTASLPTLLNTVSIRGNGYTVDGQDQYQLFTLGDPTGAGPRILVQLSNLTLIGGLAQGASASNGGGGGLGAGGAILVNSRADVMLSNVSVLDSVALGGTGGAGTGGDGGGYAGLPGGAGAVGSAGDGGFGAGGGSSQTADGGDGGFGGGGGAGATGGSGGLGGGDGGSTGGGGGGGLGGGIFVAEGGSLSVSGSGLVSGSSVAGGGSAGDGTAGAAAGSGMFLAGSGNLVLRVTPGQTLVMDNDIEDSVGAGLAPASSFQQWNLLVSGGGGKPSDPSNPASELIYGTVELNGNNRFEGNLFVEGANVEASSLAALGGNGVIALNDGGLLLRGGVTLTQDVVVDNGGGRLGVDSGVVTLADDVSGTGALTKVGGGNLVLAGTDSHSGSWVVKEGGLVLDSDSRLGSTTLQLDGGNIVFSSAFNNLRNIGLLSAGGIDNGGLNVAVTSVSGWSTTPASTSTPLLRFSGTGTTTLSGAQSGNGDTLILEGRVAGAIATGALKVAAPGTYDLGGVDRTISGLTGQGLVELGANNLTIAMGLVAPSNNFTGLITGSGGLTIKRSMLPPGFDRLVVTDYQEQHLSAGNTYSGGTTVGTGAILTLADDSSVGSGPVTLAGGALSSIQPASNLDVVLAGGGGGLVGDLRMDGVISGTGNLYKLGVGTLTLANANTYVGNTIVSGVGSYLALANADGLGFGTLQLDKGGGFIVQTSTTDLRPIEILSGLGVIDVGSNDVQSTAGITGLDVTSRLQKTGAGRLLFATDLAMPGGIAVNAGTLQVGNGGSSGNVSGAINILGGAHLVLDSAGSVTIAGDISGEGDVLIKGSGTTALQPTSANTFLGGLTVLNGLAVAADVRALGFGDVTLDANGGILLQSDIDHDITIGTGGGRLQVDGTDNYTYDGDLIQSGRFTKTGTGTLLFTGLAGDGGDVQVAAGTLQMGSGTKGVLASDVDVLGSATLVFGRDDLTQYSHVISGTGTVIKRGAGELVLTADQLFSGIFQVESGNLRVGLGGTGGALNGDVDLAAGTKLIFDRSDASTFFGSTSGAGAMQKSGPGLLTVVGDLAHTGGTRVISGDLAIGNGGTVGNIAGNVSLVTGNLVINRSDSVSIAANVSGSGTLVQRGSGSTILTGSNTQSGGVIIENGRLGVDSDARLGGGDLIMDGGLLRYEAAFNDLRDIHLRAGGGGLDSNGFDVDYDGQISGSGLFTKSGAGRLTVTTLLASNVDVAAGELRVGDGAEAGVLTGNAHIASGATLSLDRSDVVNFTGLLSGSGDLRQQGSGELRLPGNNSAFSGRTFIDDGSLRLDGILGGDLLLAAGTWVQGSGRVLGDLDAGAGTIRPGNDLGTLGVGGNLTLASSSTLEIEVDASGTGDRLNVGGSAVLAGTLHVLPQPGDYTRAGCCSYTILSAAGGVSGSFGAVQNDLVFLDTSVSYLPTQVDVSFARNSVGFTTVSLNWNQQQVSAAIDAMEKANAADPRAALIAPLTVTQARDAFEALSGDSLLIAVDASAHSAARFSQLLSRRSSRLGLVSRGSGADLALADLQALKQGRLPQAPLPPSADVTSFNYDGPTSRIEGVWMEAVAVSTSENSDGTVGSAGGGLDGQLLALGADGYWREELLLGFAVGTLEGDLSFDNRVGEGSTSGQFAGLYGRWDSGAGLQYKGAFSMAALDSAVTRRPVVGSVVARTQADFSTNVITAGFEAGLPMHLGSVGLLPHALVNAQLLQRDAFAETGDANLALQAVAANATFGEFGVGLELSRPWLTGGQRWAQLQGSLALLQPFGDTQREQTVRFSGASNSFVVKATPDDSAALALSFGAEVYLTTTLALWGGYEGRVSGTSQEHNGVLSMQYRW